MNSFDDCVSIDIQKIQKLQTYEIYVIELNDVDKEMTLKVKSLFDSHQNPLVYFIVPKKYNLLLFQLTYLLKAKSIITLHQDTNKLVQKIKNDKKNHKNDILVSLLGKDKIENESFLLYENDEVSFISESLLKTFNCSDNVSFIMNVFSNIKTTEILKQDSTIYQSIAGKSKESKKYILRSVALNSTLKVIYINPHNTTKESLSFMSSRVSFMELLKEKLLQNTIVRQELSVVTIGIKNLKNLQKELSSVELESSLNDLLHFVNTLFIDKLMFSQFEMDFYVLLYKGTGFDELNTITDTLYNKVIAYISNMKYKPLLEVFTSNINSLEFSEVLSTLETIKMSSLSHAQKSSSHIKHISQTQSVINEIALLNEVYENDISIKALNTYKGLVVNTASKIINVVNNNFYIQFESLQGVVMNIEKKTVLQSSIFTDDIEADIKKIDLKQKIAVLENFRFLKVNANARKYVRVTASRKIPIAILHNGVSLTGGILDLSIKSIAIQIRFQEKMDMLNFSRVKVVFNVPSSREELGYVKLSLGAKVIVVTGADKNNNCKIVCDLDEESNNDSNLLEYVYERQKELIVEIKKMAKLH